ncbi:phage tail assembly chaperone [Alkaliphilus peptidifermentans]|uniref:Phage XkdN-like tail assembly chaperone protein, TAC n=1 Tax=Alkaliphilus peptidifermentans DSM 18978 TaxID=1120976 RepID=A0A1G5JX53_9FIRM|nr:hypothetical protein [Alkaliphilus peptidifermentans]SCY93032.1 Phage XkdN-like tail assembly chaperone protein, TAC [Alkaliphilus peptidifermentans DSM 18978]
MAKKNIKKLTVTDLIKKKEQLKQKEKSTEELYVPSLDSYIIIQKPSRALCMEALSVAQNDSTQDKADLHMVYNCVVEPNLKDIKLQEEFSCVEPMEIVEKIFEAGEIGSISGYCLKMAGYSDSVKAVKDIKN